MPYVNLPDGELTKDSSLIITGVISKEVTYLPLVDIKTIGKPYRSGPGKWALWVFEVEKKDGTSITLTPLKNFGGTREELHQKCELISSLLGE
ncbi:hypothetical protein KODAMA_02500 [Serratia phage vB_SmaM-Kodama]|nr:hypothetical protein KODAMA_02500 [Serratia phage vB_SmaM-Kodama]